MDHRQLDNLVYELVEVFTNKAYEFDNETDDLIQFRFEKKETLRKIKERIELAGTKPLMANSVLEYVIYNSDILINKKKRVVIKTKVSDIKFAVRAVLKLYHLIED